MIETAKSTAALTDQDRAWLALYLDCNQDLHALATRLASPPHPLAPSPPHLVDLLAWLRSPPIRAALADWDHAQRRARHAKEEADRRVAIDALKAVCLALSAPSAAFVPSAASVASASSAASAPSAESAAPPPSASSADSSFSALVETRRAATTIIRALSGPATRRGHRHAASHSPSHRLTVSRSHPSTASPSHRKPRRIADFNLGPEDAERFLERERRENDRLQKLIQRTLELSGRADPATPSSRGTGVPPVSTPSPSRGAPPVSVACSSQAGNQAADPRGPEFQWVRDQHRGPIDKTPPQPPRSAPSAFSLKSGVPPAARLASAAGQVVAPNTS